ncbi:MAG: UPF0175 family protein [Hormoscilla sp.]
MQITIEIPDKTADRMSAKWGNLEKRSLEIIAAEAYRAEVISAAEVGWMLKLSTRLQVDGFLKQEGADLRYTEADLEQDIQTMRSLRAKEGVE